jgi:hypothetical protein
MNKLTAQCTVGEVDLEWAVSVKQVDFDYSKFKEVKKFSLFSSVPGAHKSKKIAK